MSWIINEFLPPNAIQLGRLVQSVDSPQSDYFSPSAALLPTNRVSVVRLQSFQETLKKTQNSRFSAFLTNLISGSHESSSVQSLDVESTTCVSYSLENSGAFFDDLCRDNDARAWMTKACMRGKDIYLVVGIKTLTDAKVAQGRQGSSGYSMEAQAPVGEMLLAAGVPIPPDIIGGAGAKFARDHSDNAEKKFEVQGEIIYAAQFRKIKFSLFSSKTVDNAFLKDHDNRWKVYIDSRADTATGPDVVDAALVDGGLGKRDLDGEFQSLSVDDEDFMYIANDGEDEVE